MSIERVTPEDQSEPARWPAGSRLLQLRPLAKRPYGGAHGNAHLGAVLDQHFVPTGKNVGIVLDGMWVLVDIDQPSDPVAQRWIAELAKFTTWQQATPRQHASAEQRLQNPNGQHWLFAAPTGLLDSGAHNMKITGANGVHVGDVKVRGYLVAPGSEITCDDGVTRSYTLASASAPVAAPDWLVDYTKADRAAAALDNGGREGIPAGEHDDFLVSLGAFLRSRWGFSEDGLATKALPQALLLLADPDPLRPYTATDFTRLARSAAKLEAPSASVGPLVPENWLSGASISLVTSPVEWWIRHFVPKGELVMVYGKGGIGKSSWGSWLAAEVTRQGGSFVFFGIEEPFRRFLWRSVLAGADRDHLFSPTDAGRIRLPRDRDLLKRAITMSGASVVYFDSIMSHFEHLQGLNIAERTRLCLAPLAEIAQETGVTIICIFHENRQGEFMGSAEMENVGRYVLGAKRAKIGPLFVTVGKTNLVEPDYALSYTATLTQAIDPLTGATQYERLEDGTLAPYEINVPNFAGRASLVDASEAEEEEEPPAEMETAEQMTEAEEQARKKKRSWKKIAPP